MTIEQFIDVGLAEIARMMLEAEGIPVLLHSAAHASLIGGLAVGGIRLQVPREYAPKAREILRQLNDNGAEG
ncbi:MAG TPA: DUF2007 domain-containing protein [Noviherbaspirillum sp.]|nr:DUF2007 domain-containing protein [Noviherbaspirillum sp.]